ncbi:ricin-type beta-trefoil lectin domain protein [Streptomyces zhihengii]|uniref:Ricin-type beta-trefoil lectin domain protein n=1 Tax=Streptomyces zhihengii TaxID=1818004 RepID=A0ABS2UW64_9ACTN|nr:ricin-type beta-trefoil lectin domain protein [Streptomyces zhihengii]MBM9621729.1 ricin-type beta-trefoil lectin domain protein [Streptomyces zhihengii]
MQHPSTPGSVPSPPAGPVPGISDEELAAALGTDHATRPAHPVAGLLARHWQPLFDYAAACAPSARTASMLATAAFSQVLDTLARNGVTGAVRPHLLVTARHIAKGWAQDPRVTTMLPGLTIPEPPAENRQLVARAFHAMPMVPQVLLWHAEAEAEGISVPAGLLGIDPRLASDQLGQAREQFRQVCVRTHREHAPTGECRHYNRLLDISLRRGGELIPDIQVHLSECRYCRDAAEQLHQSDGRLGVLLAEALLGGAAGAYLASRPGRRRQARLRAGGPDRPEGPGPAGRGRHSRSGRARAALPDLILRGRRAAAERTTPTALGIGAAVAVTGLLVAGLASALLPDDEPDHAGPSAPGGTVTGSASPAPGAGGPSGATPSAPLPSTTSAGHPAAPVTLSLRNVEADLCVDFAGGDARADADILMAACSASPSQRWVYETDGRLRSALAPGLCLDSRGLDGIVVAGTCTGRAAPDGTDVRYDLTIQGQIVPRWNEGLAVVPVSPDAGSPVAVKVRDDSPEQIWATTTTARPDSAPARRSAGDGSTPNTTEVGAPPGIFSPSGV